MYLRSSGEKVYLEVVYRQLPTKAPLNHYLCHLCYLSQNFISQFWSRLDTYCEGMKDDIRQFHIILQWEQLDPSDVPFALSGGVATSHLSLSLSWSVELSSQPRAHC